MSREFRYPLDAQDLNELKDAVWDLYSYILPLAIEVTADYTTTGKVGYEKIICNSSSPITVTLKGGPKDKQRAKILRKGTGAVTVATGGETINGAASIVVGSQYDSPLLEYTDASGEWNIE